MTPRAFPLATTPKEYFCALLSRTLERSVLGEPHEVTALLQELSSAISGLGEVSLGKDLEKAAKALNENNISLSEWTQSSGSYRKLHSIQQGISRGLTPQQALQELSGSLNAIVKGEKPRSAQAPSSDECPVPIIAWPAFGSIDYPAPKPPPEEIALSPGRMLAYAFTYIAGMAKQGGSESETEAFYGISDVVRRDIQAGHFCLSSLSRFRDADARNLIARSRKIEPKYGELIGQLIIVSLFESQEWPLGVPTLEASWDASMLYGLRLLLTQKIIRNREKTLKDDDPLVKVAQRKNKLTETSWYRGETRRSIFEGWFQDSLASKEHLKGLSHLIGKSVCRQYGWIPPPKNAAKILKLQWLARYWIAHYHYGSLPAGGLLIKPDTIWRYVIATRPMILTEGDQLKLLLMMSGFFSQKELDSLDISERLGESLTEAPQ